MTYPDDWTITTQGYTAEIQAAEVNEGNGALQLTQDNNEANEYAWIVPTQSITDSPDEVQIICDVYVDNPMSSFVFRVDDVTNEFFGVSWVASSLEWAYYDPIKRTIVDSAAVAQLTAGTWMKHKVTMWDDAGSTFVRYEYSTDGGSSYTQLGSDLSTGSPQLTSGAAGIGSNRVVGQAGEFTYFDQFELYY